MKTNHLIIALLAFLSMPFSSLAQDFSNELGIAIGPVAFKSDYGIKGNSETNYGNVGFGIGLMHYINFSYSSGYGGYTRDTYFNDHFKVRNEVFYHSTKLDHYGKFADQNNIKGEKLRAMHGQAKVLELGSSLEWYMVYQEHS